VRGRAGVRCVQAAPVCVEAREGAARSRCQRPRPAAGALPPALGRRRLAASRRQLCPAAAAARLAQSRPRPRTLSGSCASASLAHSISQNLKVPSQGSSRRNSTRNIWNASSNSCGWKWCVWCGVVWCGGGGAAQARRVACKCREAGSGEAAATAARPRAAAAAHGSAAAAQRRRHARLIRAPGPAHLRAQSLHVPVQRRVHARHHLLELGHLHRGGWGGGRWWWWGGRGGGELGGVAQRRLLHQSRSHQAPSPSLVPARAAALGPRLQPSGPSSPHLLPDGRQPLGEVVAQPRHERLEGPVGLVVASVQVDEGSSDVRHALRG
jgi:hypothetical protein